jgi:hypothetical protein
MGQGTLPHPEGKQFESIHFQVRNDVFPQEIQVQDIDWLHPVGTPDSPQTQLFYRSRTVVMPWMFEPLPPTDDPTSILLSLTEITHAIDQTVKTHTLLPYHIAILRRLLHHFQFNIEYTDAYDIFFNILDLMVDGAEEDIQFPPSFSWVLHQLHYFVLNSTWQLKSEIANAPTLELLQVLLIRIQHAWGLLFLRQISSPFPKVEEDVLNFSVFQMRSRVARQFEFELNAVDDLFNGV